MFTDELDKVRTKIQGAIDNRLKKEVNLTIGTCIRILSDLKSLKLDTRIEWSEKMATYFIDNSGNTFCFGVEFGIGNSRYEVD